MSMETEIKTKNTPDTDEDEHFLTRWSRLKRESVNKVADLNDSKTASIETTAADKLNEVAHLTDADMPPLDSLNEDSDYRGFFSPKVSDALRQEALRRLFRP